MSFTDPSENKNKPSLHGYGDARTSVGSALTARHAEAGVTFGHGKPATRPVSLKPGIGAEYSAFAASYDGHLNAHEFTVSTPLGGGQYQAIGFLVSKQGTTNAVGHQYAGLKANLAVEGKKLAASLGAGAGMLSTTRETSYNGDSYSYFVSRGAMMPTHSVGPEVGMVSSQEKAYTLAAKLALKDSPTLPGLSVSATRTASATAKIDEATAMLEKNLPFGKKGAAIQLGSGVSQVRMTGTQFEGNGLSGKGANATMFVAKVGVTF